LEDIEEAAKALALQRPTACVFHLMRAMEIAVKRLGKRVGVQNVDKEWGKILSDIGKGIEAMPFKTEAEKRKRNRWSEVHTHLYHVKQAWRNDTMHPKQTYTREQAHEVFQACRVFMDRLADLV
jgi:HEPN domain-containing protein